MKRENIDVFLEKNKNIITKIETITKKYTLADFVKTDEWFKDFIEQTKKLEARNVYRHLYSERQDCLIKEDSVSIWLVNEYAELLYEILTSKCCKYTKSNKGVVLYRHWQNNFLLSY
ncbi:hypothetical protein ACTQ50_16300 [Blautia sp. Sow4_E7]|uniref:hypothetical protein n=1 Tax=Blautia sp. Sow4_E7 TaxID=3438749 RepID=UPI003F92307B